MLSGDEYCERIWGKSPETFKISLKFKFQSLQFPVKLVEIRSIRTSIFFPFNELYEIYQTFLK